MPDPFKRPGALAVAVVGTSVGQSLLLADFSHVIGVDAACVGCALSPLRTTRTIEAEEVEVELEYELTTSSSGVNVPKDQAHPPCEGALDVENEGAVLFEDDQQQSAWTWSGLELPAAVASTLVVPDGFINGEASGKLTMEGTVGGASCSSYVNLKPEAVCRSQMALHDRVVVAGAVAAGTVKLRNLDQSRVCDFDIELEVIQVTGSPPHGLTVSSPLVANGVQPGEEVSVPYSVSADASAADRWGRIPVEGEATGTTDVGGQAVGNGRSESEANVCVIPAWEEPEFIGWGCVIDGVDTLTCARWDGVVDPGVLADRSVREAMSSPYDDCHHRTLLQGQDPICSRYQLTGGTWDIDEFNTWGQDAIGVWEACVEQYQIFAPDCAMGALQRMQINCLKGHPATEAWASYAEGDVTIHIAPAHIEISRMYAAPEYLPWP